MCNEPGLLCTNSSGTLYCVDYSSKGELNVKWVDRENYETIESSKIFSATIHNKTWMQDMCVARLGDKEVLLGTFGKQPSKTIEAVCLQSNGILWSFEGKVPDDAQQYGVQPYGIATDERGHLFVCDQVNASIQMFSVADGRFLGSFPKEGEQGLGKPKWIRCNKINNTLIVVHKEVINPCYISIIDLKMP